MHIGWCDSTLEDLDLCSSVISYLVMAADDHASVLAQALAPYYRMMGILGSEELPSPEGNGASAPVSEVHSVDPAELERRLGELRDIILGLSGSVPFPMEDDEIDDGPIEGEITDEDDIDDGPIIGPIEDDDLDGPVIGTPAADGGFVFHGSEEPLPEPVPSRPSLRPMGHVTGLGPIGVPLTRRDVPVDPPVDPDHHTDDGENPTILQPPAPESDYAGLFRYDQYDESD